MCKKIFTLFISGQINEVLDQVKSDKRDVVVTSIKAIVISALGMEESGTFLSEMDINISLIEGKFELN